MKHGDAIDIHFPDGNFGPLLAGWKEAHLMGHWMGRPQQLGQQLQVVLRRPLQEQLQQPQQQLGGSGMGGASSADRRRRHSCCLQRDAEVPNAAAHCPAPRLGLSVPPANCWPVAAGHRALGSHDPGDAASHGLVILHQDDRPSGGEGGGGQLLHMGGLPDACTTCSRGMSQRSLLVLEDCQGVWCTVGRTPRSLSAESTP